jgi:4-oxalmesaconate hydratase
MIIDIHGHYTTYPPGVEAYRGAQIAQMGAPVKGKMNVTDDEIREHRGVSQVQRARHRPDAFAAGQLDGPPLRQRADQPLLTGAQQWSTLSRADALPDNFRCLAATVTWRAAVHSIAELERAGELGLSAATSPTPGRHWQGAADRPRAVSVLREVVESTLAMVHVSATCNPGQTGCTTGTRTRRCSCTAKSADFGDFPTLRFIILHGGGCQL